MHDGLWCHRRFKPQEWRAVTAKLRALCNVLIVARFCDCQAIELGNRKMVVLGEVRNLLVNARDLVVYYYYYWQLRFWDSAPNSNLKTGCRLIFRIKRKPNFETNRYLVSACVLISCLPSEVPARRRLLTISLHLPLYGNLPHKSISLSFLCSLL